MFGLDDLLFLGKSYEATFDRFEVFFALVYADLDENRDGSIWGPPGRFAWKHSRGLDTSPFTKIVEEAAAQGKDWPPLRAGLFGGTLDRFQKTAEQYLELIKKFG